MPEFAGRAGAAAADEPVEIAAPLLLRSNALTDIDLIALIGRRGVGHARVIARRPSSTRPSRQLVKALTKSAKPVVQSPPKQRSSDETANRRQRPT